MDNKYYEEIKPLIEEAIKETLTRTPDRLRSYIIKKHDKKIPIYYIKKFLNENSAVEIISNKKIEDFKIVADIGHYQADLTFYEQYSRENKGCIGLLVVIEIPTRLLYIENIKNKTSNVICDKMKSILERVKNKATDITFDFGTEFYNKYMDDVLNEYNIIPHYANVGDKNTMAIVERVNRTIREKQQLLFNQNDNHKYYDIVESHKLEDIINNQYHRGIGTAPNNINNDNILFDNNDKRIHNKKLFKKININPGDKVRKRQKKNKLDKLGNRFSNEVYTVDRIVGLTAVLNDNTRHVINKLKPTNTDNTNKNNQEEEKKIKSEKKQDRFLRKEGLK